MKSALDPSPAPSVSSKTSDGPPPRADSKPAARPTPKQDYLKRTSSSRHVTSQAGGASSSTAPRQYSPDGEYYDTYLCLDKILGAQFPVSGSTPSEEETMAAEGAGATARGGTTTGAVGEDSSVVHPGEELQSASRQPDPAAATTATGAGAAATSTTSSTSVDVGGPLTSVPTTSKAPSTSGSGDKDNMTRDDSTQPHRPAAHDETLFIIVHQTYELWFKQILHELDTVHDIFSQSVVPENQIGVVCQRLHRITRIQEILIQQISVLETMTPIYGRTRWQIANFTTAGKFIYF